MSVYLVPSRSAESEYIIKKSRFIARATFVQSREEAMELLNQARRDYPDARHHCWAYVLGNPKNAASCAMSDDGEPAGTAGKPVLNVLQHKGVGDIMLIVIRYFGGIKLGAGGLVRAYSTSAQQVMDVLPVSRKQLLSSALLFCDFSQEQKVRHWLTTHQASINDTTYSNRVCLHIQIPVEAEPALQEFAAANAMVVE